MPPRVRKFFQSCAVTSAGILLCVVCLFDASTAHSANEKGNEQAFSRGIPIPAKQSVDPEKLSTLVVLGLRKAVNTLVEDALKVQFNNLQVQVVEASDTVESSFSWPEVDVIIAAGKSACDVAMQQVTNTPIQCTLLTEEGFRSLIDEEHRTSPNQLSALVIDQPIERQAAVARSVYPSLTRFAVFSDSDVQSKSTNPNFLISPVQYRQSRALASQLSDAISGQDALIAVSDTAIYNRSTLQTVLLTTYGYGKPVIGYSRAYVKAGALITSYSTPAQVLRQIAQNLMYPGKSNVPAKLISYPEFFSVIDNPSVARSLGLLKAFEYTADFSYTDADFPR